MYRSDLVGADDEHNAVHVGLRAHFLFHLAEPAVEGVETLPEADVINQQHPLTVLIELITHLRDRNNSKKKKDDDEEEEETIAVPGSTAPPAGRFPTLRLIKLIQTSSSILKV